MEDFIVPAIIDKPHEVELLNGLLFKLPPDLSGNVKIRSYMQKTKIGWHTIDFGYLMYIHQSDELGLIRFIGLSTNDNKPQKDLGIRHPFSKQDFERYVISLVQSERNRRDTVKEEISLLIHDLRRFSNSIYQNAIATKKAISDGDPAEAAIRIGNTLAAQSMLRVRTDILDITEINDVQLDEVNVQVYKKFDKVVRSFQPGCSLKGIDIRIIGSSHSIARGPDCIEIIAYILIDNALKYSPSNSEIKVEAHETIDDVEISVTSLGPLILDDEVDFLFEKGFRSRAAKAVETSGTGYGLYLAKSLISRFRGKISAKQYGDQIRTNSGTYKDTTFFVTFPISEKISRQTNTYIDRKDPPRPPSNALRNGSENTSHINDDKFKARVRTTGTQNNRRKRARSARPSGGASKDDAPSS